MVSDEVFRILVALGLTRLQAKVYLTLLEEGEIGVQAISRQTKLPQVDVNEALCELEKLGLVKEIIPLFA
jgi:sugar-specific transcriptional regulator TrmB